MPRKKSLNLTDAELRLMEVLWRKGEATVSDVVDALPKSGSLAYSSVLTTLRILEHKGYLTHEKQGRAFVYRAAVNREQARQSAVSHLLRRFFESSPELLVLNLVEGNKISADELERLKARIAKEKA
jgi:predicted transcriptional regulator